MNVRKGRVAVTARTGALLATALLAQAALGAEQVPAPMPVQHAVGCDTYEVEIARERGLLDEPGIQVKASASASDVAPMIEVARPYLVSLAPQTGVQLRVVPRRHVLEEGAFAGMVSFEVPAAGIWRVSTNRETWIEVAGPAGAVKSSRFQGREGCPQMRKFVEFPLETGVRYALQLSGGVDPDIKILVTGPIATP